MFKYGQQEVYPKLLTNFPYPTPEPRKRSHHLQKTSFPIKAIILAKNIAKAREIKQGAHNFHRYHIKTST